MKWLPPRNVFFRMAKLKILKGSCRKLKPPEMWRRVSGGEFPDVSKHRNAFIFRVKQFKMTLKKKSIRYRTITLTTRPRSQRYMPEEFNFILGQLIFIAIFKKATNWWLFWDRRHVSEHTDISQLSTYGINTFFHVCLHVPMTLVPRFLRVNTPLFRKFAVSKIHGFGPWKKNTSLGPFAA